MDDPSMAAAAEEMSRNDKITRDPRTRLPIIDVPPEHAKHFRGLQGTVIHWFGVVDKFNRMRKLDRRVAIFSDSHVYLCRLDGGITRCVQVRNISRALIGEDSAIGFQINAPDYDMLIQVLNVQEREAVLNVVKSVYFRLVGRDLEITNLSDDASVAMQSELKLTRPPGAQLRIEPIRSLKSLMKMLEEQKKREEDDRKVVENEFKRIKEGLRQELQQYRTDEYERMVEQLSKHAKALEEKDREILRLKSETVSKDDPELWKQCPNCARMHERLSSNSNDDKQKILRLEREVESQRHIMEHLQAAIQFRTNNAKTAAGGGGGDADSAQVNALRQELADANRRNKELQQLITQSNVLTAEVKQRAARIASHRDGGTDVTGYTNVDWTEVAAEKDREIRHLKSLLKDATFRHVQELESIRGQFQRYDDHIVDYLEKVFAGSVQPSGRGGTNAQMAEATARAARESAGANGYGLSSTALRMQQQQQQQQGGGGGYNSASQQSHQQLAAAGGSYYNGSNGGGGGRAASPNYSGGGAAPGNPLPHSSPAADYRRFDPTGSGSPAGYPSPAGGGGGGGGPGNSFSGASPPRLDGMSPIRPAFGQTPTYASSSLYR